MPTIKKAPHGNRAEREYKKSCPRKKAAAIAPVSYTHLDVYKRQPYRYAGNFFLNIKKRNLFLFWGFVCLRLRRLLCIRYLRFFCVFVPISFFHICRTVVAVLFQTSSAFTVIRIYAFITASVTSKIIIVQLGSIDIICSAAVTAAIVFLVVFVFICNVFQCFFPYINCGTKMCIRDRRMAQRCRWYGQCRNARVGKLFKRWAEGDRPT